MNTSRITFGATLHPNRPTRLVLPTLTSSSSDALLHPGDKLGPNRKATAVDGRAAGSRRSPAPTRNSAKHSPSTEEIQRMETYYPSSSNNSAGRHDIAQNANGYGRRVQENSVVLQDSSPLRDVAEEFPEGTQPEEGNVTLSKDYVEVGLGFGRHPGRAAERKYQGNPGRPPNLKSVKRKFYRHGTYYQVLTLTFGKKTSRLSPPEIPDAAPGTLLDSISATRRIWVAHTGDVEGQIQWKPITCGNTFTFTHGVYHLSLLNQESTPTWVTPETYRKLKRIFAGLE